MPVAVSVHGGNRLEVTTVIFEDGMKADRVLRYAGFTLCKINYLPENGELETTSKIPYDEWERIDDGRKQVEENLAARNLIDKGLLTEYYSGKGDNYLTTIRVRKIEFGVPFLGFDDD